MRQFISDYEAGQMRIGSLVGYLEALLSALENAEQGWRKEFLSAWGTLEEVYAVMIYQGRNKLDEVEQNCVANSLVKLKGLTASKIGKQ